MAPSTPVKRRKRASLVCNRCKRRKIKCDKKKPCSSCSKVDHPCAYDSAWAPGLHLKSSASGTQQSLQNDEISSEPTRSNGPKDASTSLTSLGPNIDAGLSSPHPMEEMVFLSRKKFDQLANARDSTALIGDFEAIIAPITIGNEGHQAFNANAGLVKTQLHDREWPGRILFEALGARQVKFEPHVTKLVKNDFLGVNPFQEYNEKLSFLDQFALEPSTDEALWERNGVFAWRTLQKKDGWLLKLLEYVSRKESVERRNDIQSTELPSLAKTPQSAHSTFSNDSTREAEERIGFLRSQRLNTERDKARDETASRSFLSENNLSGTLPQSTNANALGLMLYEDDIKFDIKLIQQMRMMIPKKRVVWLLIRRFFRVLYAFAPYLDEHDFRKVISRIIGNESFDDIDVDFQLDDRLDVIHISVLLVMIRFSYVSLFSNRVSANEVIMNSEDPKLQELRYLFKNPVNLNCIELSHRCLHQMLFLKITNVPLLQLTLFLRTYNYLAPEEGDGCNGSSSQLFNSLLVQMAYILGFNRDPSSFPGSICPRQSQLIRKIWAHLNVSDVFQGYRFGNPISTNPAFGDTKLPTDEKDNENIFDKELDHSVTRVLNFSDVLSGGAMRKLIDLTLHVKHPVYLPHFTSLVNLIESGADSVFGRLRDYLEPLELQNASYSYGKLVKCALLLSLNSFFITCLSHLLAFYRDQHNAALYAYYFKKILYFAISEILPVVPAFVTKLEDIFGEGVAVWMNPLIIDAIYRVNEVVITSIVKSNYYILKEKRSSDHDSKLADPDYFTHFQKLCEFVTLLEKFSKICIVAESIMSNRYYFAWRIFKSHQKFLQALNEPEFYRQAESAPETTTSCGPQNLTSTQLQEIIDIFKGSMHFLEKQIAENLKEFCVEEFLTKSSRMDLPGVLRNEQEVTTTLRTDLAPETTHTSTDLMEPSKLVESLRASPGNISSDISNMLELDLFMLDDFDAFNNNEVDLLWLQMSNQKMQKHKEIDEFAWQSVGDGTY